MGLNFKYSLRYPILDITAGANVIIIFVEKGWENSHPSTNQQVDHRFINNK